MPWAHAPAVETATQRIAREITIMQACGGAVSRADWMGHLAEQLAAARPLSGRDLRPLVEIFEGSPERAARFVSGVEAMSASFAAKC